MPLLMITNSIKPYAADVMQALALPRNISHRFRYSSEWIQPELLTKELKGEQALIVLREYKTGEIIPLRYARIESVVRAGDVRYLVFSLGELFPENQMLQARQLIQKRLAELSVINAPDQNMKPLLIGLAKNSGLFEYKLDDVETNWSKIVSRIGSISTFNEVSFLRCLRLYASSGKEVSATRDASGTYSMALTPGELYFLDVFQNNHSMSEDDNAAPIPFSIELKGDSSSLKFLRSVQPVVGKYDLLRYSFKVPIESESRYSYIELEPKELSDAQRAPGLFIPVRVELSKRKRAWKTTRKWMGGIAVTLFLLSAPLSKGIGVDGELVRTIALFLLILAAGRLSQLVPSMTKGTKLSQEPDVTK